MAGEWQMNSIDDIINFKANCLFRLVGLQHNAKCNRISTPRTPVCNSMSDELRNSDSFYGFK